MIYALLDIKMDRPIDKHMHYISPGGYEIGFSDKSTTQFDFLDYEGYIDDEDPSILHCKLKNPDTDAFPNMLSIRKNITKATELIECYIYTGEHDDPEINLDEIISFKIIDDNYNANDYKFIASTDYVTVNILDNDKTAEFTFTQKLIDTYKIK